MFSYVCWPSVSLLWRNVCLGFPLIFFYQVVCFSDIELHGLLVYSASFTIIFSHLELQELTFLYVFFKLKEYDTFSFVFLFQGYFDYLGSFVRPYNFQNYLFQFCEICHHARMHAKSLQSCLTLCDPMDYSPSGSSVHGILQARILEWFAMSSSRVSSQPRDQTHISCTAGRFFTAKPWGKPLQPLYFRVTCHRMVLK